MTGDDMYELIKLSEKSYYIESPAKVGVYCINDREVVLIDSGNDKDAGKKIKRVLDGAGWQLTAVLNTHYHADHIGGNAYLQQQTGCRIYAPGAELGFVRHPILEPSLLWGGDPPPALRHKFLMASPSDAALLTPDVLPHGLSAVPLPGHSLDMTGFRTEDGVLYLADCLSSLETLEKYGVGFIADVGAYLETLEAVKKAEAVVFVPAHAAVTDHIAPLAEKNIAKVQEIAARIGELCRTPRTFEEILQGLFETYALRMTFEQYALVGSTLRSYLTWMKQTAVLEAEIDDNRMLWHRI